MDCSNLYEATIVREYEDPNLYVKYKCTVFQDDDIIWQYTSVPPPPPQCINFNGLLMGQLNSVNRESLPPDVFVLLLRYKCSLVEEDNTVLSTSDRSECFWIKKKLLLDDNNAFGCHLAQFIRGFDDSILMFDDAYDMVKDIIEFARKLEEANLKHGHDGVSIVYDITTCRIWYGADQIIQLLQESFMRRDQEENSEEDEDEDDDDEDDDEDDDITSIRAAASRLVIESLPKGKFEGDGKAIACTVCLEEIIKGEEVLWMPCTHYYHQECITKWLGTSNICPLCRFSLPPLE